MAIGDDRLVHREALGLVAGQGILQRAGVAQGQVEGVGQGAGVLDGQVHALAGDRMHVVDGVAEHRHVVRPVAVQVQVADGDALEARSAGDGGDRLGALVADEALQAPAQRLAAGVGHQLARLLPGEAHHQSRAVETDRIEVGQPALRVHVQAVALGHAGRQGEGADQHRRRVGAAFHIDIEQPAAHVGGDTVGSHHHPRTQHAAVVQAHLVDRVALVALHRFDAGLEQHLDGRFAVDLFQYQAAQRLAGHEDEIAARVDAGIVEIAKQLAVVIDLQLMADPPTATGHLGQQPGRLDHPDAGRLEQVGAVDRAFAPCLLHYHHAVALAAEQVGEHRPADAAAVDQYIDMVVRHG